MLSLPLPLPVSRTCNHRPPQLKQLIGCIAFLPPFLQLLLPSLGPDGGGERARGWPSVGSRRAIRRTVRRIEGARHPCVKHPPSCRGACSGGGDGGGDGVGVVVNLPWLLHFQAHVRLWWWWWWWRIRSGGYAIGASASLHAFVKGRAEDKLGAVWVWEMSFVQGGRW